MKGSGPVGWAVEKVLRRGRREYFRDIQVESCRQIIGFVSFLSAMNFAENACYPANKTTFSVVSSAPARRYSYRRNYRRRSDAGRVC